MAEMTLLVKKANELYRSADFNGALSAYERVQLQYPELRRLFDLNVSLCERQLGRKSTLVKEAHAAAIAFVDIHVTLTTISERLPRILPVLESLHRQTLKPCRILLNLSDKAYLLDRGISKDSRLLEPIEALPLVEINWTTNTGPYRKIVPFMERFFASGDRQEKVFITVDDDTVYPEYFVEELYRKYLQHDSIVAFRGRRIAVRNGAIATYKDWDLGQDKLSMMNLPTGKDGVIYSTRFFTEDFLDIEAAMQLAPTADDLWIKWHCGLNGVKSLILNPEAASSDYKSFPVVDYSASYRDLSLYKVHNSMASGGNNDTATRNLEAHFMEKYGYNLHTLMKAEGH